MTRRSRRSSVIALASLLALGIPAVAAAATVGIEWQSQTASSIRAWDGIAYGNGLFVAVSTDDAPGTGVMTSPTGSVWTERVPADGSYYRDVAFGNGKFVAVGSDSAVMTSTDGVSWTARTMALPTANFYAIAFGRDLFVAVGGGGSIQTSPDGITWTSQATGADAYRGVAYGNGMFVAAGGPGIVVTSPDGITWSPQAAAENNDWYDVSFGDGLFVAVAISGTNRVMISPDGTTWNARAAPTAAWRSVAYGECSWVAVAGDGATGGGASMWSPDGYTWSSTTPTSTDAWRDVAFGAERFVAVSLEGTVMTSGPADSGCADAASVPYTLSLDARDGTMCRQSSLSGTRGTWVRLPGPKECTAPTSLAGARLLGWATSPGFPTSLAQRQVDMGWGPYEMLNAKGQVTSVFVPAGSSTVLTGSGTLYPMWGK